MYNSDDAPGKERGLGTWKTYGGMLAGSGKFYVKNTLGLLCLN